jgi:DNA-binding beta-propeller fold protein YncE/plastocyanin
MDRKHQFIFALLCMTLFFASACASNNTVAIKDQPPWYFPAVLEVEPGTTVTWDSMAAIVHPVGTLDGPEKISSGHFTETWSYKFEKPGIYHYYCPLHPYMQGYIGVGVDVPEEITPSWIKQWPPESAGQPIPGGLPKEPGLGEVWLDAQFQVAPGMEKPGAIVVVDAQTWEIKKVIIDKRLNNPHNMWLSDDKNHVLQTNWFDKYLSVIDRYSGLIIRHVYVGESPAHVMTAMGNVYVTLQGADGIAVLDGKTYEIMKTLKAIDGEHGHDSAGEHHLGTGPHGHSMSKDHSLMALAHTEGGSISVWDLETEKIIFQHETDPLPLMAGISDDNKYAWTASLLTGKFSAFDISKKTLIKEFIVGKAPVQPVLSPDGKYILVALSGDGAVGVVNASTFEIIKTLPSGAGAHGVIYGPKKNSGWYAYVSNKFVPWITVIDMDNLEVAGYVPVPKDSLGGQGILAVYG